MPTKYTTHSENPLLKTINADTKLFEFPHSTERNLHSQLFGNDAGTATKISCDSSGNLSTSDTNITSGNDDTLANAQQVGLYAHDSSNNWKALQVDSNEALKTTNAHINAGASQSSRSSAQIVQVLAKDDGAETLSTLKLDATGNLMTTSSTLPTGAATEAKQDTMISSLSTIEGDTTSIDGKITACDTGNVSVSASALPTGAATAANQSTTQFLLGLLATKAEQANQSTNLTNIDNSTANIDGKIAKSPVVSADGTTSAQAVMMLGSSSDASNLRTLQLDDDGRQQCVMLDENGNSISITNGILETGVRHTFNVESLLTTTTLTAGSATTTNALDIGNIITHDYNDITFFVDNSNTSVQISIQPQSSPDGTNWYVSSAGTSVSTKQAKSFLCSDNCLNFGRANRYLRLRIVNDDGSLSTDVSVQSGRYN